MRALFILIASLALAFSCKEQGIDPTPPNVIIIMTDDQGWGDLSFHGNRNLQTPNIDSIAINGVVFENFYVQPVCSPSRAELLTGRYSPRLGVYSTSAGGERLNIDETTIAEVFKKAGYNTALVGKWHSGTQAPYHPNARGFDHFYGFTSGHWANYFDPGLEENGKWTKGKGYIADDLTSNALEFIKQSNQSPFFLWLAYNTPHSPMQVPDQYWNKYAEKTLPMRHRDSVIEDIQFTRAALAMVENIDFNVGRINELLKRQNLMDNTIVIFLSDNGPNGWRWNQEMKGKKGSTDEGGVRSPFFVQWTKEVEGGRTIPNLAAAIDIMPTLASMAGISIEIDKPIDGVDLSPLIFDQTTVQWPERQIFHHWNNKTSIRTQRFKLDHENRLYNMQVDREQRQDLSEKLPELRDSLIIQKNNWLADVLNSSPDPNDRPFTLGHPDFENTWLPARDGIAHGQIKRSNQYPNASFFTNWRDSRDFISWDVQVLQAGTYEAVLFYTAKEDSKGSMIELAFGEHRVSQRVSVVHDPVLKGMENDRYPRIESYTKDFKPLILGRVFLEAGRNDMLLKALNKPGVQLIDVQGLQFRRVTSAN